MDELIALLERKNLCFRSFHKLCSAFLDEIARGETSNLDDFQRKRLGLIKVLEQLEGEVGQWLSKSTLTADPGGRLRELLHEKEGVVKAILDLDEQILTHIARIKDQTVQKLQALNTGRKTIAAYRSPIDSVEAAEGNKAFDREA